MFGVRFKAGVDTSVLSPAGVRILGALDRTARRLKRDVLVTCGNEAHPPSDPHTLGSAFDVRTHGLDDEMKRTLLREVMLDLQNEDDAHDGPIPTDIGLSTLYFYGQIEKPNQAGEHCHIQLRRGVSYTG